MKRTKPLKSRYFGAQYFVRLEKQLKCLYVPLVDLKTVTQEQA